MGKELDEGVVWVPSSCAAKTDRKRVGYGRERARNVIGIGIVDDFDLIED
jgi:hypothetical protein